MNQLLPDLPTKYNLAKKHFEVFVEEIISLKNAAFHNELDRNLTHPLHKKVAISFARGHGKSTHLSVAYPLWEIAKNHNVRILLISATATVSKSFMTEIIGHIERNDDYQAFSLFIDPLRKGVVPKMKNYKKSQENWAGDSIVIDREEMNLKDPTIHALGLFGGILSKRADIIICDDIVNQENSATEEQRLKTIDWIYTTVIPVLVPGGKFIYLGNTWHMDDLVARLLKDPKFDYKKRMPAIIHDSEHPELWQEWARLYLDESKEIALRQSEAEAYYQNNKILMDEGIVLLWPERFDYKFLYLERLSNPYSFARMYQCDPSDRPDQKFKEAWLEAACRKGAGLKLQDEPREGLIMDVTASGLDLAISLKDGSDDTAHLTLDKVKYGNGTIQAGDYVIRNIEVGKMTPKTVRDMVVEKNAKHKPDGIRVESVGYQESMVRDLEDYGIPVRGYHTGGEKKDPEIGVNSLAILAENNKLVLPFDQGDPRTLQIVSRLMNEMRAFPDGHTGDILMALWFAYCEIRDIAATKYVIPGPDTVRPPADLSNPVVRAEAEHKADMVLTAEQEAERAFLNEQMRGLFRRY